MFIFVSSARHINESFDRRPHTHTVLLCSISSLDGNIHRRLLFVSGTTCKAAQGIKWLERFPSGLANGNLQNCIIEYIWKLRNLLFVAATNLDNVSSVHFNDS